VKSLSSLTDSVAALLESSRQQSEVQPAIAASLGFLNFSATAGGGESGIAMHVARFLEESPQPGLMPAVADVRTDIGDLYIAAHDEAILDHLRRDGTWEPDEAAAITGAVSRGMTVLDLGAHVGYRTILMARLVGPTGRVIAVEAAPANFALLNANIYRHGLTNVLTVPLAAGERRGEVELAISTTNTGDNRLFARAGEGTVKVKMQPLDDLFPANARLDFIKSDLQGYDQRALRGMEQALKRSLPSIVVEFCPRDIRDIGDDPIETLGYYRTLGYDVSVVSEALTFATDGEVMARAAAADHEYVNLLLHR
jgi:FkbM family methyltransferase